MSFHYIRPGCDANQDLHGFAQISTLPPANRKRFWQLSYLIRRNGWFVSFSIGSLRGGREARAAVHGAFAPIASQWRRRVMKLKYLPMPSEEVRALQAGGKDAYGCAPERTVSDGEGNPCRHCLDFVPKGRACSFSPIALFPMFSPMLKPGRSFCVPTPARPGLGRCSAHFGIEQGLSAERLYRKSPHQIWNGESRRAR